MRKPKYQFTESKYANDLAKIMGASPGPFTRSMLAKELANLHPQLCWQDLMNEVSGAIQQDRWAKTNRFKSTRHGWYELS